MNRLVSSRLIAFPATLTACISSAIGYFCAEMEKGELIILFDGVCNLCNGMVQFVIKNDAKKQFKFASLQSQFGQETLQKFQLPTNVFNSFILLENGKIYTKSTAALRVAKRLKGLWPLLYGFMLVPKFIRNFVYDLIARNRYKWFGKQDACWLPTPELKARFFN